MLIRARKREVRDPAHLRRLAGVVRDGDGTAQVLPRHFADHHLAEHLQAEDRDVGGLRHAFRQALAHAVLHAGHHALGARGGNLRRGADAADALPAGRPPQAGITSRSLRAPSRSRPSGSGTSGGAGTARPARPSRPPVLRSAVITPVPGYEPGALRGAPRTRVPSTGRAAGDTAADGSAPARRSRRRWPGSSAGRGWRRAVAVLVHHLEFSGRRCSADRSTRQRSSCQ